MKLPDPVAYFWLHNGKPVNVLMNEPDPLDKNYWDGKGFSSQPLYTSDQIEMMRSDFIASVRRAALEEAAQVCESSWRSGYRGEANVGFAHVIRALIETEQ